MFEKIRRRVANSTWNDFLKVLMMYVDNIIGELELQDLVSSVIGTASNDLVSMFEDFMRRCAPQPPIPLRLATFTCINSAIFWIFRRFAVLLMHSQMAYWPVEVIVRVLCR